MALNDELKQQVFPEKKKIELKVDNNAGEEGGGSRRRRRNDGDQRGRYAGRGGG